MSRDNKTSLRNARMSRRSFLGYAGSTALVGLNYSPAVALFTTILAGESQKAWAASLGIQPRSLVQILEGGAPTRWMFDSFLTPYSSTNFNRHPMVGTQFKNVGGRYIGVDYVTSTVKGIQAPQMWTHDLPAPNNAYRPMANLLDNLLCVQGVTTKNGGHASSQEWHWLPPGGDQSTAALSADASSAPLAAIQAGADGFVFRSNTGKTAIDVADYGNMLTNLLDPFKKAGSAQFQTNKARLGVAYDSLLPSLDELARQGHPGADALTQNRSAALNLMETNFTNLGTEWTALQSKYQSLVTRAIYDPSKPLAGVNDLPIGEGGAGAPLMYQVGSDSTYALNLHLSTDLRSAVDTRTSVYRLAEHFAFTEYILKNKLSSSISFSIGDIGPFIRESDGMALNNYSMSNDQHFTGIYPNTYFNLLRHRAVAACLLELIETLKSAGLFNDTVISLSGEFNRNPKDDFTGSDHGWTGKSISLYSGAFTGPMIIGNLTNDDSLGWGAGGIVPELGRQLTLVDTAVTLAHLLRVPPPFTSSNPLVTLGSNGLVSNIGTTHHVLS